MQDRFDRRRAHRAHPCRQCRRPSAARLAAVADAMPDAARRSPRRPARTPRRRRDHRRSRASTRSMICTPTDTHADLIERAAQGRQGGLLREAGRPRRRRASAMPDVVAKAEGPLMIGFNRRFDPSFAALKRASARARSAPSSSSPSCRATPRPPPLDYVTRSGGLFRDMMIHDLDMARFLLGEEPVEVHAVGSCLVDQAIGDAGDVDTAAVLLKTASGKIAQISMLAARHLRLRPAHRSAWREGHARARATVSPTTVELRRRRRLPQRSRAALLPRALRRGLPRRARRLPRPRRRRRAAPRPRARMVCARRCLADAATEAAQSGAPVRL